MQDAVGAHAGRIDDHNALAVGAQPDFARVDFGDGIDAFGLQDAVVRAGFLDGLDGSRLWVDKIGAVTDGGDPDSAAAVFEDRADGRGVAMKRGQFHRCEARAPGIAADQALGGADPEIARPVAHHGADLVVRQICAAGELAAELGDFSAFAVQVIEPVFRADPQAAGSIVGQAGYGHVAQASRSGGIGDETVLVGVVARQAAGAGADPQRAGLVGEQDVDIVVGQAAGAFRIRFVDAEAVAVPAGYAVLGAYPDKAFAVLGDRGRGGTVGQVVVARHMLKGDVGEAAPPVGVIRPCGGGGEANEEAEKGRAQNMARRQAQGLRR